MTDNFYIPSNAFKKKRGVPRTTDWQPIIEAKAKGWSGEKVKRLLNIHISIWQINNIWREHCKKTSI